MRSRIKNRKRKNNRYLKSKKKSQNGGMYMWDDNMKLDDFDSLIKLYDTYYIK